MSKYKPEVVMYYGSDDNDHRLVPAPNIDISLQYNYSNDTIIGYSYIITLNGVASSLDLRALPVPPSISGDPIPDSINYGLGSVADHMNQLRKILSQNGNILSLLNANDKSPILKAYGGILRSFNFDQSNNNWVLGANYTASLEFNYIDFMGYTDFCGTSFLDVDSLPSDDGGLINLNKFNIKSFQDSWNISFDESNAFGRIKKTDNNEENLNINNTNYQIQYTINATGKNTYQYTDIENNSSTLLPAWEQAKNFVQHRLYYQITNLLNNVLKNTYTDGCSSTDTLSTINIPGSSGGLLSDIGDSKYKIFNEEISCDYSESDGTFSATYNAIVSNDTYSQWSTASTTHTVNKSIKRNNTASRQTLDITINGTIQGLIEGGLIRINEPLELPNKGSILIYNTGTNTKYDNAKALLDLIYDPTENNSGEGCAGKHDLNTGFKTALGITTENLEALSVEDSPSRDPRANPPHPTSFNITHDYNNGTINYTIDYSSNNLCGRRYKKVSLQISNPTKLYATFNIPNSFSCPVIQELGTYTAKKISISIEGNNCYDESSNIDLSTIIDCQEDDCLDEKYWPLLLPPDGNYVLTQKQYTINPIDGSYTASLGYICNSSGCDLSQ